jgi:hypothetical protein
MSTSTDAIIAFGFDLGDEEDLPEQLRELLAEHEHETDECLAADHGIELPQYATGCDYKEYSAGRESALARLKIDLIPHCSGDYTMYFLAARGSDKKANRGYPTALEPYDLDSEKFGQEAIDAMHRMARAQMAHFQHVELMRQRLTPPRHTHRS